MNELLYEWSSEKNGNDVIYDSTENQLRNIVN